MKVICFVEYRRVLLVASVTCTLYKFVLALKADKQRIRLDETNGLTMHWPRPSRAPIFHFNYILSSNNKIPSIEFLFFFSDNSSIRLSLYSSVHLRK